ncbi:MAG: hypothetical protein CMO81_03250 [Waddliaceae bacterium]|nr:hypothetical protein [Waddliaceae bacterium]
MIPHSGTYIILPSNKDCSVDDIHFREYAEYVEVLLRRKGWKRVHSFDKAKWAVLLGYSVSDPKERRYTYQVPIFGQTGVSSSTTYGTYYGYGNYSSKTTYTPTYGIIGSSTQVGTLIYYARAVSLRGVNLQHIKSNRNIGDADVLWETSVSSVGSSGDLREVFPAMILTADQYFMTNTSKKIKCKIDIQDKRVKELQEAVRLPKIRRTQVISRVKLSGPPV